MIADTIQKQIAEAMKAGEAVRVSTLKMLSAAFFVNPLNPHCVSLNPISKKQFTSKGKILPNNFL